jgi:HEPN domain-containing protein
MIKNIDKYKSDLDLLIKQGNDLFNAMQFNTMRTEFLEELKKDKSKTPEEIKEFIMKLPNFYLKYQSWYSESQIIIKQLLPNRLNDFMNYYNSPKNRKEITVENYTIEDYLKNITVSFGGQKKVGSEAAFSKLAQQNAILLSVKRRFESTLFDIKSLIQADLFDSELDAASELLKHGFYRAAGAISGVVLEKHLKDVLENHSIKIVKKNPSISDYNDKLKDEEIIDLPVWRTIQFLGDIRNLCDHNKEKEPTKDQVSELIAGASKIIKTVF